MSVFGLANQLQRAAISVPANIAEGHAREHTRDFLRFLSIAAGLVAELETHLIIAVRLGYQASDQMQQTLNKADEVGRMLRGLQKALHAKLSTNNP
jgi:four helix bundle protein